MSSPWCACIYGLQYPQYAFLSSSGTTVTGYTTEYTELRKFSSIFVHQTVNEN